MIEREREMNKLTIPDTQKKEKTKKIEMRFLLDTIIHLLSGCGGDITGSGEEEISNRSILTVSTPHPHSRSRLFWAGLAPFDFLYFFTLGYRERRGKFREFWVLVERLTL